MHLLCTLLFINSTSLYFSFFFFNDTATTEIYTLSLHDALPISVRRSGPAPEQGEQDGAEHQRHHRGGDEREPGPEQVPHGAPCYRSRRAADTGGATCYRSSRP